MKLKDLPNDMAIKYLEILDMAAKISGEKQWVKTLDLGVQRVRLISYAKEFTPHVEKQLSYILQNECENYDTTLVIWKYNPEFTLGLQDFEKSYEKGESFIHIDMNNNIVTAYNSETNTYYYGVENLESEEFIKQGHIFVQTIAQILKTETSSLVHGATVGIDNKGILFCAGGGKGKSTLSVCAMMDGFDYVSDDYLTLEKTDEGLFARPIYSIITLSPRMYNELYYDLKSKFVSNNARKDKYVLNISEYHNQFSKKYPIKLLMFPQISADKEPSIIKCEKGKCVVPLISSTLQQMQNRHDVQTVKKLTDFVKGFETYQINLTEDIWANEKCLKEFLKNYKPMEEKDEQLCIK